MIADQRPDAGKTPRPGVVLLHGFFSSPLLLWPLARRLRSSGFRTFAPSYPSWRMPLDRLVDRLLDQIDLFACKYQISSLHLVGHSMGGLLIRALLTRHRHPLLGRVVMLGTPNSGSEIADMLHANIYARWVLGEAAPLLMTCRNERVLQSLGKVDYPVGVIAGNKQLFPGPLARRLPRPHDGKVSVAATHLDGEADHIVLPLNHTNMVFSSLSHRQVLAFLTLGQFTRADIRQL